MFFQANSLTQQGGVYYSIFNEDIKKDVIANGSPIRAEIALVGIGQRLTHFDEGMELGYKTGYTFKANSVEELARQIGVDPKALRTTVDKNNVFAENSIDEDILKQSKWLRKMEKGPWYAVKMTHTILNMNGGPQCNENLQVYHKDGHLIPGLYVTGVMIGGLQSDTYPMPRVASGTDTGFFISAGRIIVNNIAKELGKQK
jgi:fumarate reductase flavoprotein subunit